jgi:hypothetical protein
MQIREIGSRPSKFVFKTILSLVINIIPGMAIGMLFQHNPKFGCQRLGNAKLQTDAGHNARGCVAAFWLTDFSVRYQVVPGAGHAGA